MRDKFIISLLDGDRMKQFSFHLFIKKVVLYALLFIFLVAIAIFFTIKLLANELKDIQSYKDNTISKYVDVYSKNKNLEQQIEISKIKIAEINKEMADLEEIVNSSNTFINKRVNQEFDTQSLSSSQKDMILQLIPNGYPSTETPKSFEKLKSGIAISISNNTPIYATADGIIDLSRDSDTTGLGKFIKVVHTFGFTSIYGYLSKSMVKRGEIVSKGQLIGYSGKYKNKDSLFYDIRFLGGESDIDSFMKWNMENFNIVFDKNSNIDWNGLFWTLNDMIEINNHKIFGK